MKYDPIYYGEYLKLDKILDAQNLMSDKYGKPAHDETLFIIIHQTYELWFKQILHEIDSIHALFDNDSLAPNSLATISHRLNRITEIQRILNDQLNVIETMSPLDFMEFRDYLVPASGFQSIQFRMIELKLGLRQEYRLHADKAFFNSRLRDEDKEFMLKLEEDVTLLELIDNWLSRLPFGKKENFDFWEHYQETVEEILKSDEDIIRSNKTLNEKQIEFEISNLNATRETFSVLFDDNKYNAIREKGEVRISREAKLALIFIKLFKDEPILQMPNQILDQLIDIDELFTTWRYRHAIMAHRMLGRKIGTGGSSGHDYLKKSTENNRVFTDLFNVATFLIPKSTVPKLPVEIKKDLSFSYE